MKIAAEIRLFCYAVREIVSKTRKAKYMSAGTETETNFRKVSQDVLRDIVADIIEVKSMRRDIHVWGGHDLQTYPTVNFVLLKVRYLESKVRQHDEGNT